MRTIKLFLIATVLGSCLGQSAFAVSGEGCVAAPPQVGYRPSLFECNGNAAVLFRGSFRNAYSVVLRARGQYNDRDPNNTGCATNRCSPYKTQKRIELPEYQVNCLGDNGYSDFFARTTRISVKFQAEVTNSSDPSQFQQYCLEDKTAALN
ncbi:MAG: hypothetical protein K1X83_13385 [Oligoflexia bacterium]|nr:hypothetical protein [Oligoflexia bacterium]